jgi:ADP-heptose:LPS heptosyltransferase
MQKLSDYILTIFRYTKNFFSYFLYHFLKLFFKTKKGNINILFINSGQIGDLVVSSMIFDNDEIFNNYKKVYFLLRSEYYSLFKNYKGKVELITYDYKKLKWSLIYRLKLLKKIRSLNLKDAYNITAARGMLNDQLTLLSGAENKFTICKSWKYLMPFWGKLMDKEYDDILFTDEPNEYKKHISLINLFSKKEPDIYNIKTFNVSEYQDFRINNDIDKRNFIAISPLSSVMTRTWGIENFKKLCSILKDKYELILIGSKSEISILKYIAGGNKDIRINTCDLEFLPVLIDSTKLFIGSDSGLTHIALKLNKPFVAILDGGYFNMFFPFQEENRNFKYVYNKMDCFECDWKCIYREPKCLTQISMEQVLQSIDKLLK